MYGFRRNLCLNGRDERMIPSPELGMCLTRNSSIGIYSGSRVNFGGALETGSFQRLPYLGVAVIIKLIDTIFSAYLYIPVFGRLCARFPPGECQSVALGCVFRSICADFINWNRIPGYYIGFEFLEGFAVDGFIAAAVCQIY